jgi:hypothetical protein
MSEEILHSLDGGHLFYKGALLIHTISTSKRNFLAEHTQWDVNGKI